MIEPGIYYDISHSAYNSMTGYVSNSYLSRLDICPAAAKVPQEETDAMRFGTAFHCFILDGRAVFDRDVAIEPEGINRRTNEGKATIAAFHEENKGKAIITAEDFSAIVEMDKAVKAHPLASNLIASGCNEVSIFWEDPFSGLPCKARPDKTPGQNALVDLKKTRDASSYGFRRSVLQYGYHRQAAFYLDGMTKVTGEKHDLFAFIAVEQEPPYRVEVYTLSDYFITAGRQEYQRLITVESRCREANEWPNYQSASVTELELPKYMMNGGF